jgi:hypothetical protein
MSLTPNVLETRGEIGHLIRTNRAGDALQRMSASFELARIVGPDGLVERCETLLGLLQEAHDDPRDRIGPARPLQLPQLQEPRHINRFAHNVSNTRVATYRVVAVWPQSCMHRGVPHAKWPIALVVMLVIGVESPTLIVHAQSQPDDPQHVVQAFELALAAGDVDYALAQFADDAVVTVQAQSSSSYTGKQQVRAYLEAARVQLRTLARSTPIVQGSSVTWSERDQLLTDAYDVSVYATVRSSRIATLVYHRVGLPVPVEQAPAQVPSLMWGAAIALLGLGLLGVVFGRPRRRASHSRLDGRLLHELRKQHQVERVDRAA